MKFNAPFDPSDPATVREWLDRLATVTDDAIGVAEDQLRPPSARNLGRRQARVLLDEASVSLTELIALMRGNLPQG